ncbi:hypothetical protein ACFPYJ_14255 [Paenibacillus solisilvae]|uniref:Phosphodiester glycosidase domain-containing protein n=1 Tax=Paenibacillus solisilvae TaxID=2486751 RepID=A0ABW0VWM0_9BACL
MVNLSRSTKRRVRITTIAAGLFILLTAVMVGLLFQPLRSSNSSRPAAYPASEYEYSRIKASNGFQLHVLKSDPSNITLELPRQNVTLSDYYGINGGFFYNQSLLSMAIVNGIPIGGAEGQYGAGSENVKYRRGTLVWDGAANTLSVQIVSALSELKVSDPHHFWAQGGISMSVGQDALWKSIAIQQNVPYPDDNHLRSAIVYDHSGAIYLVVSSTEGKLDDFRSAILETVGGGRLADGIFLDGDGSSQMQAAEIGLNGDNRPVVQMIRIVR